MEKIVYIRSVFDNMLMNYFINLIIALALTLIIEFIPIVIFLRISPTYFAAVNILTNIIANTIVFIIDICSIYKLGFIGWTEVDRLKVIFVVEIFVVISEIILYYLYFGKKNLFKISLLTIIANTLSYFLGKYIFSFI